MAKNKSRSKRNSAPQAKTKNPANTEEAKVLESAAINAEAEKVTEGTAAKTEAVKKTESSKAKAKEILYQVTSKRDSGVLKAYITFTYRMLHPGVSVRLMLYGLIIALPGIFFFKDLYWRIFFTGIGVLLILLGLFRQYISLWMTKRNDPDYKSGAEFTYNFTNSNAAFLKNGVRYSGFGSYKDITGFYHDDAYLYMGMNNKELIVIPKSAFTIGDSDSFEEFIYKKCKKTCHWLPNNYRDAMKKRRAARAIAAENMSKK